MSKTELKAVLDSHMKRIGTLLGFLILFGLWIGASILALMIHWALGLTVFSFLTAVVAECIYMIYEEDDEE